MGPLWTKDMGHVKVETIIDAPIERCFDAHRDMGLHIQSTAHTGERIVHGRTSGLLQPGEEVTFEARHFGFRFRLTSRITEFDRPTRFVDEMVRGPFRGLRHVHKFCATSNGTKLVDEMTFEPPLGTLGRVFATKRLEKHLESFLINRNRFLKDILESG